MSGFTSQQMYAGHGKQDDYDPFADHDDTAYHAQHTHASPGDYDTHPDHLITSDVSMDVPVQDFQTASSSHVEQTGNTAELEQRQQQQLDKSVPTIGTVQNFLDPSFNPILMTGTSLCLMSLNQTITNGANTPLVNGTEQPSAYTPLAVALNEICFQYGLHPVEERDLVQLQREAWFSAFAKQFVKRYYAERAFNVDALLDSSYLSEERMALIVEAFAASQDIDKIHLGIVVFEPDRMPKAFHFPDTGTLDGHTVWIFYSRFPGTAQYCGIGRAASQMQLPTHTFKCTSRESQVEADENVDTERMKNHQACPIRQTTAAIRKLQVPLPPGLSGADILNNHIDKLHYVNMLKVALEFGNQAINKQVCTRGGSSGIVKRIQTAVNWIEDQYHIDKNAFRTVFDRERRRAGISCRAKEEVSDDALGFNAGRIEAALAWIRRGGPWEVESMEKFGIAFEPYLEGLNPPPDSAAAAAPPSPEASRFDTLTDGQGYSMESIFDITPDMQWSKGDMESIFP